MLDHVSITVADADRSFAFWDAIMHALGHAAVVRRDDMVGYGARNRPGDDSHCYIAVRASAGPFCADNRHWCFRAPDRAAVDRFHRAGLACGGTCDGAPGLRAYHASYYAAFLRDPGGNRVEAVCHRPEGRA